MTRAQERVGLAVLLLLALLVLGGCYQKLSGQCLIEYRQVRYDYIQEKESYGRKLSEYELARMDSEPTSDPVLYGSASDKDAMEVRCRGVAEQRRNDQGPENRMRLVVSPVAVMPLGTEHHPEDGQPLKSLVTWGCYADCDLLSTRSRNRRAVIHYKNELYIEEFEN